MEGNYALKYREAAERAGWFSGDVKYELFLNLQEDQYSGNVCITFALNKLVNRLWLDYGGRTVHSVLVNNLHLPIERVENKLMVSNVVDGDNVIKIEFSSEYSNSGTGLHKYVDSLDSNIYIYSYACPYYCNRVFPCFDQPDLKGRFSLKIETLLKFSVISAEKIKYSESSENAIVYHFAETQPISTYILGIVCGDFAGSEGQGEYHNLGVYFRKSLRRSINIPAILQWTKTGIDFYENYFAYKLPFSKYDQVFCPQFIMGAMENAGCVTINDAHVWREAPLESEVFWLCNTILHELCHMWFGNLVTLRWWDDLWLNESFATYFSYFLLAETGLLNNSWLNFLIKKT